MDEPEWVRKILLEASGAVGSERFAANQGATLWANKMLLALIAGSHEAGNAARRRASEVEKRHECHLVSWFDL